MYGLKFNASVMWCRVVRRAALDVSKVSTVFNFRGKTDQ